MHSGRSLLFAALLSFCCLTSAEATHTHRKPTSGHASSRRANGSGKAHAGARGRFTRVKGKHVKAAPKLRGQQAIDTERAQQIQTALIREHYMTGEATGVWDEDSRAAMAKFQADNGWQTKVIPDSRALIKLGLGPEQSAGTTPPAAATPPSVGVAATSPQKTAAAPSRTFLPPPAPANTHTLGAAISAHNKTQNVLPPQ